MLVYRGHCDVECFAVTWMGSALVPLSQEELRGQSRGRGVCLILARVPGRVHAARLAGNFI